MLAKAKAALGQWFKRVKVKEQAGRFVRLAASAFVASGIVSQILTGQTTRAAVVAAAVGAVEVAYRAMVPTVSLESAKAAAKQLALSALMDHFSPAAPAPAPAPAPVSAASGEGSGTASAGAVVDVTSAVSEPVTVDPGPVAPVDPATPVA